MRWQRLNWLLYYESDMIFLKASFTVLCFSILTGCMSTQHVLNQSPGSTTIDYEKASAGGRYTILQDHGPSDDVKVDHLPDLVPKWEPKSRGGNKSSYEVWGKTYYVMDSAEAYKAEGTASWYGKKFHGHNTSNGEVYDMYSFSAAHKNLPLPTYLKVTNLDNQRSVIVRVNDRGPFHGDRLIDLSYAAAVRLDYHKSGLARVRIEAITPRPGEQVIVNNDAKKVEASEINPIMTPVSAVTVSDPITKKTSFTHLQVGAFSQVTSAERMKVSLFERFDTQIKVSIINESDSLYKVIVGPYDNDEELADWINKIESSGFNKPVRIIGPL